MNIKKIYIADDFSDVPYGRYDEDGPDNGQRFRENHLLEALKDYDEVHVYLDGAMGYGSSFLEEAFGGLYRTNGIDKNTIKKKLKIVTDLEFLKESIWDYIADARKE
ncbi:STAS-like domain-containing protein [Pectobacterium carotovorum]|uniref:STAS-like domain-containing protein n=1 Tax=Pectobacterium carotovorum TaxID=554 RepID=UPI00191D7767|nr:STAS-like domain-containing protein [Pectobacterium carotovorum]MBL0909094.1 STAS-like domain-containing protein [Pectobacterium carotovorum]